MLARLRSLRFAPRRPRHHPRRRPRLARHLDPQPQRAHARQPQPTSLEATPSLLAVALSSAAARRSRSRRLRHHLRAARNAQRREASVGYACHFIGKGHLDHRPSSESRLQVARRLPPRCRDEHGSQEAAERRPVDGRARLLGERRAGNVGGAARRVLRRLLRRQGGLADRGAPEGGAASSLRSRTSTRRTSCRPPGRFATIRRWAPSFCSRCSTTACAASLYDNTLLLFSADNGGTLTYGNNFPLMGHKHDAWEGGSRVTAFLAGGFLPPSLRGAATHKLVHIADWYPTFCNLGGADPADAPVIGGAPRPIDGVDVWPLLTAAVSEQPRPLTVITEVSAIEVDGGARKLVQLAGQSNRYTPRPAQRSVPLGGHSRGAPTRSSTAPRTTRRRTAAPSTTPRARGAPLRAAVRPDRDHQRRGRPPRHRRAPRRRDRQGERGRVRDGEPRQRDAREVHEAGAGALGRVYRAVLRERENFGFEYLRSL